MAQQRQAEGKESVGSWRVSARRRPRAYEIDSFPWSVRRVPETADIGGSTVAHPGRRCAIFLVHGMGQQQWTETATTLRSGFEDALEAIREWQAEHLSPSQVTPGEVPPPFTYEGYWANYAELEKSFPEDWQQFNERERLFFGHLWEKRAFSAPRTCLWLLGQQLRLLNPRSLRGIKLPTWLLYLPLQVLFPITLLFALIRSPRLITRVLADVRLYAHPQGMSERAIVQRIDYRVGREFLRLIGLDWDFRPLPADQQVKASGVAFVFDRVVWVAHSLGTVISYNVLSDLFQRAEELSKSGDRVQKAGVDKFRTALRRFVTLGSPLDKFAFLFPDALRPWPTTGRPGLLTDAGDTPSDSPSEEPPDQRPEDKEWWINYYHVLDPVSGALSDPLICGPTPPLNTHTNWRASALVPGLAHGSYWTALSVLRFVLGRVYGSAYLQDRPPRRQKASRQTWCALAGYVVWAVLLGGALVGFVLYRKPIFGALWKALKSAATSLFGT